MSGYLSGIREIVAKKIEVKMRQVVSERLCREVTTDVLADDLSGRLEVELRAFMLETKRHHETDKISVPRTWWDHFKRDVFPDWLLFRYPPKYTDHIVTITSLFVCPHLAIPTRNDERDIHFAYLSQGGIRP